MALLTHPVDLPARKQPCNQVVNGYCTWAG